jgi:uncharacterized membrane protein YdbT with pleckstrin-like domain
MNYSDKTLRVLTPSQWVNLPFFIAGVVGIQTVILPILAIVKYIEYKCWRYEFGERTIVQKKGILSVTITEINFYRIKSIKIDEPFWMRLLGLSNVTILTSDPYQKELLLYAVPNGIEIRSLLRSTTHKRRREEGVKEFDMYSL